MRKSFVKSAKIVMLFAVLVSAIPSASAQSLPFWDSAAAILGSVLGNLFNAKTKSDSTLSFGVLCAVLQLAAWAGFTYRYVRKSKSGSAPKGLFWSGLLWQSGITAGLLITAFLLYGANELEFDALAYAAALGVVFVLLYWLACWALRKLHYAAPSKLEAETPIPVVHDRANNRSPVVVAVGGTGAQAILDHERARFIANQPPAHLILFDADTATDGKTDTRRAALSKLLLHTRGVDDVSVIAPITGGAELDTLPKLVSNSATPGENDFDWTIPRAAQRLNPKTGFYGIPALGATTIAFSDQRGQFTQLREILRVAMQNDQPIVLVGGISGGTGPSALPNLTKMLTQLKGEYPNSQTLINVVAIPAWFAIKGDINFSNTLVSNRNAAMAHFARDSQLNQTNSPVRIHVLQWPIVVERPNAGKERQPEQRHIVNHVVAATIADALLGKLRGMPSERASTVVATREPAQNGSPGSLKLAVTSNALAYPVQDGMYLSIDAMVRLAQMQRRAIREVAGLLRPNNANGWGPAFDCTKPLEPASIAGLRAWIESQENGAKTSAANLDGLAKAVAALGQNFDDVVAVPFLANVADSLECRGFNNLPTCPTTIEAPDELDPKAWPDFGARCGSSRRACSLVERVAHTWPGGALREWVEKAPYTTLTPNNPTARAARLLQAHLISSTAGFASKVALAQEPETGWLTPLKPRNDANPDQANYRYGHYKLNAALLGGERFDGRDSKPDDEEFELRTDGTADSFPAMLPMRYLTGTGLVAHDSSSRDRARTLALGKLFAIYNGAVKPVVLKQATHPNDWLLIQAALKLDGLADQLGSQLDGYVCPAEDSSSLGKESPFALKLPGSGWTLVQQDWAIKMAEQWHQVFTLKSVNPFDLLTGFVDWCSKLQPTEFPASSKNALMKYLLEELKLTKGTALPNVYPGRFLSTFYATPTWLTERGKAGFAAAAPVGQAGLATYQTAKHLGILDDAKEWQTSPHVFLVQFTDCIALALAKPQALPNDQICVFALPTHRLNDPYSKLRIGLMVSSLGGSPASDYVLQVQSGKDCRQISVTTGTAFANLEVSNPTAIALSLKGQVLGVLPMPHDLAAQAPINDQVTLAIDFGTSNSIILVTRGEIADQRVFPLDLQLNMTHGLLLSNGQGWESFAGAHHGHMPWLPEAVNQGHMPAQIEAPSAMKWQREWQEAKLAKLDNYDAVPLPVSFGDKLHPSQFPNVITTLKFEDQIRPEVNPIDRLAYHENARKAYLRELLRPAFFSLKMKGVRQIKSIIATRPGAMPTGDGDKYIQQLNMVLADLGAANGIGVPSAIQKLEGVAAAAHLLINKSIVPERLNIALDLGGGTLDLFFCHGEGETEISFSWSIKWAGRLVEQLLASQPMVREILESTIGATAGAINEADALKLLPFALRNLDTRDKIKAWLSGNGDEKAAATQTRKKIVFFFQVVLDLAIRAMAVGVKHSQMNPKPNQVNMVLIGGAWQLFKLVENSKVSGENDVRDFILDRLAPWGFNLEPNVRDYSEGTTVLNSKLSGKAMIAAGAVQAALTELSIGAQEKFENRGAAGMTMNTNDWSGFDFYEKRKTCAEAADWAKNAINGNNSFNLASALEIDFPIANSSTKSCLLKGNAAGNEIRFVNPALTNVEANKRFIKEVISRAGAVTNDGEAFDWPIQVFVERMLAESWLSQPWVN